MNTDTTAHTSDHVTVINSVAKAPLSPRETTLPEPLLSGLREMATAHFSLDGAWRFVYIDRGAAEYLGVVPVQVQGHSIWEIFPEALDSAFRVECYRAMESGRSRWFHGLCIDRTQRVMKALLCPHAEGMDVFYHDATTTADPVATGGRDDTKYRALLSLLPVAVYTCDMDGHITMYNAKAAEMWGRAPRLHDENDKYCGSYRLFSTNGDSCLHCDCWMGVALKEGTPVREKQIVIERPDGIRFTAVANVDLLYDDEGRPIGAVNVLQDLTDSQQAERVLRESEDRYRELIALLPVGVYTCDREGCIQLFNAQAREIWGREPALHDTCERFCGAFRLFRADGTPLPHDETPMATTLRTGESFVGEEVVVERPDGSRAMVSVNIRALRSEDGTITGAVNVFEDITRQKVAEQALRENEMEAQRRAQEAEEGRATLEALLEFIPEGICVTGGPPDFQIKAASQFGLRMTGISEQDLFGVPAQHNDAWRLLTLDGSPVPPDQTPLYKVTTEGRRTLNVEFAMRTRDGRTVPVAIDAAPIRDFHGRVVGAVKCWRDITERKEIEKQWSELNNVLEQRVAKRTEEVQHLVDELRGLAAELGRVEQRERRRLARILHDHVQQLLVAAKMRLEYHTADIEEGEAHENLLDIVNIIGESITTSRSLTVELSPPVLHEAGLGSAIDWLAARLEETHGFKVHVDVDRDAEPEGEELRYLFFESVREALFNAIKHSGTKEGHVAMTLTEDDRTCIEISDSGKGFDPDLHDGTGPGGTSLGLFSIHQRLTHFGGGMRIISSPANGVQVILWGPINSEQPPQVDAKDSPKESPSEAADSLNRKWKSIRVLIVDDHKILREGLVHLLGKQSDIEIVGECESAEQAIEFVAHQKPDVIIMDINLPGMSGIEATRIITHDNREIAVIGLSMHEDKDIVTAMREAGAQAYHTKGEPVVELIASIRTCCHS